MKVLFVVSHPHDWPLKLAGASVVPAQHYLTDPVYSNYPDTRVFNLCTSCDYQSSGYYVSMLAEARGHRPIPDVNALEDLHSEAVMRTLGFRADQLMAPGWMPDEGKVLELACFFGQAADSRYQQIAAQLFRLVHVPLLHARFERDENGWHLKKLRCLTLSEISAGQLPALSEAAAAAIQVYGRHARGMRCDRPAVAILRSPDCAAFPSNPAAILKFQEAAELLGMRSELITHADSSRLAEFDALFIRDTTNVNHYTYQLARQAALAGLVVMDDPDSIVRCSNKVYLAELLSRHKVPIPKTMLVHQGNLEQVISRLGLPCILKRPDGAFSLGVEKVKSEQELQRKAEQLLACSEIILAQEYLPTEFDWRIGVLDREPLFACKYFMAPGHWQVIKHGNGQHLTEGRTLAVPLHAVPEHVMAAALQAANLIGDGLYGVDLKQRGSRVYVIEVNDNPNVDAGNEDAVLQEALYHRVMSVFKKRIAAHREQLL